MVDMTNTILAKSDQLTADDLLSGPRTITITRVSGNEGNADQPVNIFFDGDCGKPFRPCKTMRRVMVAVWGPEASKYVGRSMTVYRDPKVKWGGMEVGGIRISHMTGLQGPRDLAVQETRGVKKAFRVQPLTVEATADKAREAADKIVANVGKAPDADKLNGYLAGKPAAAIADWRQNRPDLAAAIDMAVSARMAEFSGSDDDDPFASDDTPPYAAAVAEIERLIGEATDALDIDAARQAFDQHRQGLPDDIVADLDSQLARKAHEVRGE